MRALVLYGDAEVQRGKLTDAESPLERALELARGAGDDVELASGLNKQSRLRERQGRNDDALALLREALSRTGGTTGAKSDRVRGETLEMLGRVYRDRGDPAQALRHYTEALEIARGAGDGMAIATRLNQLGNLRHRMGQFQEAVVLFREAKERYLAVEDRRGTAAAANNLGTTLLFQGELEDALAQLEESRTLFHTLGDERNVAAILSNLGTLTLDRGKVDEAARRYEASLRMHLEHRDASGEANVLNNLSHLAVVRGDPEEAIRAADQSLEIRRVAGIEGNRAKPLFNRGEALLELERLDEAEHAVKEAWAAAERGDSDEQRAEAASLAAMIAVVRGNLDDALREAGQAVLFAAKNGGVKLMATSHHALAAVRIARREFDLAQPELSRATNLLRGFEHAWERARVLADEGRVLAEAGSLEGAVERLRRAEREFAALGNARWRIRVLVRLSALTAAADPSEHERYLAAARELALENGLQTLLAGLLAEAGYTGEARKDGTLAAIRASRTQDMVSEISGATLGGADLGACFDALFRFIRRGCGAVAARFEPERPAVRALIDATAPTPLLASPPDAVLAGPAGHDDVLAARLLSVGPLPRPLGRLVVWPSPDRGFSAEDLSGMEIAAAVLAMAIEWHLERMDRRQAIDAIDLPEGGFESLVGSSPAMRAIYRVITQVAPTDSTVLLLGESGTGKELAARALHAQSRRARGPFVAISCPSIPRDLIESELFGHERGAFTGATATRPGKVELAGGGTLFLDEIGDMALATQVKLLRFLQEREFQRVGGNRDIRADVRVVAATSRNLTEAIEQGEFREDLYYRLHVVPIRMPALRERKEDIPALVNRFLDAHAVRADGAPGEARPGISARALEALREYDWPGNVRQLQNAIERLAATCPGDMIDDAQVQVALQDRRGSAPHAAGDARRDGARAEGLSPVSEMRPGETLESRLMDLEARLVRSALEACDWNQSEAARRLGVTETKVRNRMKRFGIRPPSRR